MGITYIRYVCTCVCMHMIIMRPGMVLYVILCMDVSCSLLEIVAAVVVNNKYIHLCMYVCMYVYGLTPFFSRRSPNSLTSSAESKRNFDRSIDLWP